MFTTTDTGQTDKPIEQLSPRTDQQGASQSVKSTDPHTQHSNVRSAITAADVELPRVKNKWFD